MFLAYLVYVAHNGVNVVYWDDWHTVKLNENLHAGTLHFSQLWAQHNIHRILFPNIVGLVLGTWFHFDVKLEMYVGACLLALAVVFIVRSHQFLTSRPLHQYAPVVALIFTPVQWENTLWGFQVAWFLVLASFAGAAYVLCRFRSPRGLAGAIAFAVAASFSSLQGLFTWPLLALLLWSGKRSRAEKITWVAAGIATGIAYFYNFDFAHTGQAGVSAAISHPLEMAQLFLVALGGFALGVGGLAVAAALGLIMLLVGLAVLALYVRSDRTLVDAFPAVLVLFALLFDLSIAIGRITAFGAVAALAPRYVTFNLLIFVAGYLSMLHPRARATVSPATAAFRYIFAGAAGGLALVLAVVSVTTAVSQGEAVAAQRRSAQAVLVNYQVSSDFLIRRYLFPQPSGPVFRRGVRFLEQRGDSVFADHARVKTLRANAGLRIAAPDSENPRPYQHPGGDPAMVIWMGRNLTHRSSGRLLIGVLLAAPWLVVACIWLTRRRQARRPLDRPLLGRDP